MRLVRGAANLVLLLLAITFLSFAVLHLAPGDPFTQLSQDPTVTREYLAALRHRFGLDRPLLEQYGIWMINLAQGDLGISLAYRTPVARLLLPYLGNTLALTGAALVLTWIIAIPLGIFSARREGELVERAVSLTTFFLSSLPDFYLAFLLVYFAATTGLLPVGGTGGSSLWSDPATYLLHLAIPCASLTLVSLAGLQRIARSQILEEIHRPYALAVRAKGASESRLVYLHCLPNAAAPLVTLFALQLSGLLSGAALVEIVTSWPGLGTILLEATISQDIYVVMASLLFGSLLLVACNLLADLAIVLIDPRARA